MKKKVLLALGAFVVAATIGALGASADSPGVDVITATVLHGPSVGSFNGDVRHLPQGNKVPRNDDARRFVEPQIMVRGNGTKRAPILGTMPHGPAKRR